MVTKVPQQDKYKIKKSDLDIVQTFDFNNDALCVDECDLYQSLKSAIQKRNYDLKPAIKKSDLEGVQNQQTKGIRGFLNSVFESKTLIGDDIYLMDAISADRFHMNPPSFEPKESHPDLSSKQNDILAQGARMLTMPTLS